MSATDRLTSRWGLIALGIMASLTVVAQTPPAITQADIERARKANPMPTEQELARVPRQTTPNVDGLPKPSVNRPIDLEALAKGYEGAIHAALPQGGFSTGPGLLIFVSFSMPEETLARLVDQAARSRATLMLRGFVNGSLKETVGKVRI